MLDHIQLQLTQYPWESCNEAVKTDGMLLQNYIGDAKAVAVLSSCSHMLVESMTVSQIMPMIEAKRCENFMQGKVV